MVDVCCGTGTIGLVCAPFVGRVVGVESSPEAVQDAERNRELNNSRESAVFLLGKAEALMRDILPLAQRVGAGAGAGTTGSLSAAAITEVVAIVDPPRSGLHPDVIKALRTCKALKRIVYVSCNPAGSLVEDAAKLSAPPRDTSGSWARGPELRPVAAFPVDLFPHTPHAEMVMIFERD